jgi:DNA-binding CsgD family transcriptional regulator
MSDDEKEEGECAVTDGGPMGGAGAVAKNDASDVDVESGSEGESGSVESDENTTTLRDLALRVYDASAGISERAQAVLALSAFGFSQAKIARDLHLNIKTVKKYLDRYDRVGIVADARRTRDVVVGNMIMLMEFELLSSFRPGELRELQTMDKLRAIKILADAQKRHDGPAPKAEARVRDILAGLKHAEAEISEGVIVDAKGDGK